MTQECGTFALESAEGRPKYGSNTSRCDRCPTQNWHDNDACFPDHLRSQRKFHNKFVFLNIWKFRKRDANLLVIISPLIFKAKTLSCSHQGCDLTAFPN